jgi:GH24 family phage-related lysozyme (muramidase)
MSDSEDSRIRDPAGVQDDGPGHPGNGAQGEECVDDDDYGLMPGERLTRKERSLNAELRAAQLEYEASKRAIRLMELYIFKASRCRNAVQAARYEKLALKAVSYNALAHK